jgi:hypothetical protein
MPCCSCKYTNFEHSALKTEKAFNFL